MKNRPNQEATVTLSSAVPQNVDVDRLWQVYDAYRTALLNSKYYGHRLSSYKKWDKILNIAVAIGTPGGIGSLAIWQTDVGGPIWLLTAAVISVLAAAKPFLNFTQSVERYSKLYTGHTTLYHDLRRLVLDIEAAKELSPDLLALFHYAQDRERELGPEDDPKPISKLVDRYEKEVKNEVPIASLWIPSNTEE